MRKLLAIASMVVVYAALGLPLAGQNSSGQLDHGQPVTPGLQHPPVAENLALDPNVTPADFIAAAESFAARTAQRRSPLNLIGDNVTDSFMVLSAANTPGKNNSYYKTDLAISPLWASSSQKVYIYAIPNNTSPLATGATIYGGAVTLTGGLIYHWDDILGSLGMSGAGYLLVGMDPALPSGKYLMAAWANTYTAAPGGGFYRTPVPIFTDRSFFSVTYSYDHPYVHQDAGSRTNVLLYNVSMTSSLVIDLYFGLLGTTYGSPVTLSLAPGEAVQYALSGLFPSVPPGTGDLYFDTRSGSGWMGYVIRTDNGSNDGSVELPYPMPSSPVP